MKEIELTSLDIKLYTETLDNGLDVYLIPYDNKNNYFMTYATKFGSDVLKFDYEKEEYTPPLGIAHFLEHKMFETESGIDPFTFFSESGTDGNAMTTYDNTKYICSGTKNFEENLNFLIDFVNEPYFTDENVEKEKGIIAEELKMYDDIPDYKMEMRLRENVYINHSRKYDIGGSVEEIYKITKEDLYKCYNSFYTPNNMFILILGNMDVEKTIKMIKNKTKKLKSKELPKIIKQEEPARVSKKEDTFYDSIEIPKVAIGIKIPKSKLKLKSVELDLYLNMFTNIVFGSSSEFRERVRSEKLLNDIYTEWEDTNDFKTFYLFATTTSPSELIEEIKYELDNKQVSTKAFERIKKVWIANEVKIVDNIERMESNIYDDIIKYNKVIDNRIELIRKMEFKKLTKLLDDIDLSNISILKVLSKEKSD